MKTQIFCYFRILGDRARDAPSNRTNRIDFIRFVFYLMMEEEPASNRCICFNKNETWKESSTCPVTHQCNKSLYFASSLSADKNLMMFVLSLLSVSFVVMPLTLLPSAVLVFQFITTVFVGINDTIFYSTE